MKFCIWDGDSGCSSCSLARETIVAHFAHSDGTFEHAIAPGEVCGLLLQRVS